MGGSKNNGNNEVTNLFDSRRNDVVAPDDNLSTYRNAPVERQNSQSRDMTFRTDDGRTINIRDSVVNIYNGSAPRDYDDERSYRVGNGRNSYVPEYDRQAEIRRGYNEERYINSYQPRIPIPECFGHGRGHGGDGRFGDSRQGGRYQPRYEPAWACEDDYNSRVRNVGSNRDYDYRQPRYDDRQGRYDDRRYDDYDDGRGRGFERGLHSVGRFLSNLMYAARPAIQAYAQIKMAQNGHGGYFGGNNGYYRNPYDNPYNRSYPGGW